MEDDSHMTGSAFGVGVVNALPARGISMASFRGPTQSRSLTGSAKREGDVSLASAERTSKLVTRIWPRPDWKAEKVHITVCSRNNSCYTALVETKHRRKINGSIWVHQ